MRRVAEATVFLALAAGLHLIPLVAVETQDGAASSGEGGEALTSVAASSASVSAMVEQWETPPEVAETQTSAPTAPAPNQDTTPPSQPQTTPDAPTQSAAPPDLPQSPDAGAAPAAPPPPPAAPEPEPEPEPEVAEPPEPEPEPEPASELAVTQSDRPSTRPQRPDPPQQTQQAQPQRQAQPEPERQAQPSNQSSRASAGQRAAGSGGGSAAGASRQAQSATSTAERQSAIAQWGATIRARVERRKSFPRNARQSDGRVVVQIRVARSGALAGASVARSSGDRALDRAALRAVQSAGRFPGAPDALREAAYTFNLPIAFNR